MKPIATPFLVSALVWTAGGCSREGNSPTALDAGHAPPSPASARLPSHGFDSRSLIFEPHAATNRLDREILHWQQEARGGHDQNRALERLGWAFVAKAQESFEARYYQLAEQCAVCLGSSHPGSPESLLLRGHALHNLHRFHEAEPIARAVVEQRGLPFDYGLLGDVLMEQGRLAEATHAYQRMIDLRPDLHSYARGAHIRWLNGDLQGATELMRLAVSASNSLDPESAAWVHTRLGFFRFQAGAFEDAYRNCEAALEIRKEHAPALLLRGRILLADGKASSALESLRLAARRNPLPEYLWVLAEALAEENLLREAGEVEAQLRQTGSLRDPRTYALFLATRGQSAAKAVRMAEEEFKERSDVFTHDAMAWALAAAGRSEEAQGHMEKALAQGTQDARLFFHAAVIASRAGRKESASRYYDKAAEQFHLLLPSERRQLSGSALDTNKKRDGMLQSATAAPTFSTHGI